MKGNTKYVLIASVLLAVILSITSVQQDVFSEEPITPQGNQIRVPPPPELVPAMTINNEGNIAIGASNSTARLQVTNHDVDFKIFPGQKGDTVDNRYTTLEMPGLGILFVWDNFEVANSISVGDDLEVHRNLVVDGNAMVDNHIVVGGNVIVDEELLVWKRIGIGTQVPETTLQVLGETFFSNGNGNTHFPWITGDNYISGFNTIFRNSNNEQIAKIDSTGRYAQGSDYNLKKNITPLGNVLDKVLELKPSSFHFKQSPDDSSKLIGFIAQDVEEVFPSLVDNTGNNGTAHKLLAYDNFGVLAIAAIQEQQEIIDEQQDVLEELKSVICPDNPQLVACQ